LFLLFFNNWGMWMSLDPYNNKKEITPLDRTVAKKKGKNFFSFLFSKNEKIRITATLLTTVKTHARPRPPQSGQKKRKNQYIISLLFFIFCIFFVRFSVSFESIKFSRPVLLDVVPSDGGPATSPALSRFFRLHEVPHEVSQQHWNQQEAYAPGMWEVLCPRCPAL